MIIKKELNVNAYNPSEVARAVALQALMAHERCEDGNGTEREADLWHTALEALVKLGWWEHQADPRPADHYR